MKKKLTKRKIIILSAVLLCIIAFIAWVIWANTALVLTEYSISSDKLPKSFDGFKIAHISDLHNAEMGKDNRKLINMLKQASPDIIVFTGDLVDSRHTDVQVTVDFMVKAAEIAPCYYVTGNHEAGIGKKYGELKKAFEDIGVTVLKNTHIAYEKDGESIYIAGVEDPMFISLPDPQQAMHQALSQALPEDDGYKILLTHRPELFDIYSENKIDLVFAGHAHGGQIRLPFIGAVYVPNQGWFPKYTDGVISEGKTNMVISRGIGNSSFPIRFNNRPEVIVVTLNSK